MKKRNTNYSKKLLKQILEKSPQVAGFICMSLFELGMITVNTFLSPKYNFDESAGMFLIDWQKSDSTEFKRETIRQGIKRLQKQGIVKIENNKTFLSNLGRKLLEKIKIRNKTLNKKWDGKYRLVIFDIPEKKSITRNWLREELYLMNYSQLQKSVFVGKYLLTEDIIKDIKLRKIEKFVNYLLVDKIYDDSKILKA